MRIVYLHGFASSPQSSKAQFFQKKFAERGPRDAKGRSLRDLNLKTRLFEYPVSYMIYSEAFDNLPAVYLALELAKTLVQRRRGPVGYNCYLRRELTGA